MASTNVNLNEEAYQRLMQLKMENESFSDVVIRLAGKTRMTELAGLLTEKEAAAMKKSIQDSRKRSRQRSKRLEKEFHDIRHDVSN